MSQYCVAGLIWVKTEQLFNMGKVWVTGFTRVKNWQMFNIDQYWVAGLIWVKIGQLLNMGKVWVGGLT